MEKLRPETLCIQAGYTPGNGEPRQLPIVQSTTFKYETSEDMGKPGWQTPPVTRWLPKSAPWKGAPPPC